MAPSKVCPQCHTKVHIRLCACSCGYTFAIKRTKPVSLQKLSKNTEMKFIREKEPEVVSELRKESDKHQKANFGREERCLSFGTIIIWASGSEPTNFGDRIP